MSGLSATHVLGRWDNGRRSLPLTLAEAFSAPRFNAGTLLQHATTSQSDRRNRYIPVEGASDRARARGGGDEEALCLHPFPSIRYGGGGDGDECAQMWASGGRTPDVTTTTTTTTHSDKREQSHIWYIFFLPAATTPHL
eukprot:976252-Prorocentrum_minimum.AAC.5